jgi:hypothetical protein
MPLDRSAKQAPGHTIVRGACPHDCPDTCALHVTVADGRAIKVEGDPDHPTTRGVLCTKVARYLERTYSEKRLLHPLRRVGAKGEGRFERIGWDEALDTIASRFREIADSADGPQAILPYSYAGTMGLLQYGSMDRRLFHKLGASLLDRTICATAGKAGYAATIGASIGTDLEQFENARLILIWGSNPVVSNLHLWSRVQEAKRRGAKLIAIDPYRSQSAEKCHEHLALMPGTDAALALGVMHVLIAEDLIDRDYIDRYTLGFDALEQRVRDYPPSRVAALTGLREAQIIALAALRHHRARVIRGAACKACRRRGDRTVACLPALVGAAPRRRRPSIVQWHVSDQYGGARASGELEQPARSTYRQSAMHAQADDPPIRALFVYNSNPVAVAPDRTRSSPVSREDLFCVVRRVPTDTADYADIVLPARRNSGPDVHSCDRIYALANNPAIAPWAKPSRTPMCSGCSPRGWFDEPCFAESDEHGGERIRRQSPAHGRRRLETLKTQGWQRLNVPSPYAIHGRQFPTRRAVQFYSESLHRRGSTPAHLHAAARSVATTRLLPFPLAMLSPPARNALNSSFGGCQCFWRRKNAVARYRCRDAAARVSATETRYASTTIAARSSSPRASPIASARCRRRAVDLVAQAFARRHQCEHGDRPGADRHGPRGDVL